MTISHLEARLRTLERGLVRTMQDAEDAQRRIFNLFRPARISQIDHKKYRIKAVYAKTPEGEPVETPWIRWSTRSGKIKEWSPPSIGEQIMMISPSGNIGVSSWGAPGGYSNANPPNHDQDGEWKMTIGKTSITVKDGQVLINTPHFRVETPGGKVEFDNSNSSIATEPPGMPAWQVPMGDELPSS